MSEMIYYRNLEEQLLCFPVQGKTVGIELKFVKSISLITELIPIPRSPNYVIGIVNIDSNIYPVIDLDVLLSGKVREDRQIIVSLIDIKDTVFGINTHQLPSVVPGAVGDLESSTDVLPKDWIIGFSKHDKFGEVPIIDPKKFWIGMGENQVMGPSLDDSLRHEMLIQEDSGADYTTDDYEKDFQEDEEHTETHVEPENTGVGDEIIESVTDLLVGEDELFEKDADENKGEDSMDLAVDNDGGDEVLLSDDEIYRDEEYEDIETTELNDLTSIESVGPKMADDLKSAGFNSIEDIANSEVKALTVVEGIGKKTAERLISNAKKALGQDE